jgi:hypothetical protein
MVATLVSFVLALGVEESLLLVSNACFLFVLVLYSLYTRLCDPAASQSVVTTHLCVIAVFPSTVFYHFAYSESLFATLVLLFLIGLRRSWPAWLLAVVAGLASGSRPVGIVFLPILLLYVCAAPRPGGWRLRTAIMLTPLACWGLLAYMAYQAYEFSEPLAFAMTQKHWHTHPSTPLLEQVRSLVTLEPVWGMFVPGSRWHWRAIECHDDFLHSMVFINPIAFVATATLVAVGYYKRLLTKPEALLSALLVLFPYCFRGYDNSMLSTARFCSVAVPCYRVVGTYLAKLPPEFLYFYLALAVYYLGVFSALFSAEYLIF